MIEAGPDLVILYEANFGHYETLVPALEGAGIATMFVSVPSNFAEVIDCIHLLGEAVGAPDRADQMVREFEASLSALEAVIASIPLGERIRVSHYWQYGANEIFEVIAEAAGVQSDAGSIVVRKHYDYMEIDHQLLSEWNPDLLTFTPFLADTDGSILEYGDAFVERRAGAYCNATELSSIAAIQNKNVHPLNIYNSQFMVQSAWDLARLAYPAYFDEDGI